MTQDHPIEVCLQQQAIQEPLLTASLQRIHGSLDLQTILNTAVQEVQQKLNIDRVIIYRFMEDGRGWITHEACKQLQWSIMHRRVEDRCFDQGYAHLYLHGRIRASENIEQDPALNECHRQMLRQFQIQANLVVPIIQKPGQADQHLWGLLIAHQCTAPRPWSTWEAQMLKLLTAHLAIALHQSQLYQDLQTANAELQRLANLDGLTQIANRRQFDIYLNQEWRRLRREQDPLSLVLCDVDFFKRYNDAYGHLSGDDCLRRIATALHQVAKRPADLATRYGGEEFALVLPNTDDKGAASLAVDIQQSIAKLGIHHGGSPWNQKITLSIGIATMVPQPPHSPQTLIERADQALYQAKAKGRNQVCFWPNDGQPQLPLRNADPV